MSLLPSFRNSNVVMVSGKYSVVLALFILTNILLLGLNSFLLVKVIRLAPTVTEPINKISGYLDEYGDTIGTIATFVSDNTGSFNSSIVAATASFDACQTTSTSMMNTCQDSANLCQVMCGI